MRVGPELQVSNFLYRGDPTNTLTYEVMTQPARLNDFQSWLQSTFGTVPAAAGKPLFEVLVTRNPTPIEVSNILALPALSPPQYEKVLRGLAYFFLTAHITVTISNVHTGPTNTQPVPSAGSPILNMIPPP